MPSTPASRAVAAVPLGYVPEGNSGHRAYMAKVHESVAVYVEDLYQTYGQHLTREQHDRTIELCLAVKREYGYPMQRRYILFADYARALLSDGPRPPTG